MSTDFDLSKIKSSTEEKLQKTLESLSKDLQTLRTGRVTPAMLDHIKVDSYGSKVGINQVGTITASDARTLVINLWSKDSISEVEKAIHTSDIGANPVTEGLKIRLHIPPMTEERRKELKKKASEFAEKAKIAIRQIRKHYLEELKTAEKNKYLSEDDLRRESDLFEKTVKSFSEKVDNEVQKKSQDIMNV